MHHRRSAWLRGPRLEMWQIGRRDGRNVNFVLQDAVQQRPGC